MKINNVTVDLKEAQIKLTGEDIANVFWVMGSDEQAEFFSTIGDKSQDNLHAKFSELLTSQMLTVNGKDALREISDIIKEQLQ